MKVVRRLGVALAAAGLCAVGLVGISGPAQADTTWGFSTGADTAVSALPADTTWGF